MHFQEYSYMLGFLRWHYPDQVLGFEDTPPRLSRPNYQRPIKLSTLVYYGIGKMSIKVC